MGLHHTQLFPHETSSHEMLERAKVARSLYVRDKSLCTTRGSVSWLPTHDCNITSQLSAAVERQLPYSNALQMAMIQDEIYRLTNTASFRTSRPSRSQTTKALRSIEHQLEQYTRTFGIFNCQASSYNSRRAMLTLDFLTTRILAVQHGSKQRHAEQLRSDARASCFLLLIAHGVQDRQVIDAFNALAFQRTARSDRDENLSTFEPSAVSFASILDAFSIPAFFILLKDVLRSSENDSGSNSDLDLLRKVSTCYTNSTERMQSNSYHRKVAWTFEQLLIIHDLIKNPDQHHPASVAPSVSMSQMLLSLNAQPDDCFNIPPSRPLGDAPNFSFSPQPTTTTPFSWDIGSSIPSSLGPCTPFGSTNSGDASETGISDMLDQLRPGGSNDSPARTMSWPEIAPEPPNTTARKRLRTHDESEIPIEKSGQPYMFFNSQARRFPAANVGSSSTPLG